MGEDKSDKFREKATRPTLGDITNQRGKRGFSQVSPSKSGNRNEVAAEVNRGSNDDLLSRVKMLVDKLKNEYCGVPNCPNYVSEDPLSPGKAGNERAAEPNGESNDSFFKQVAFLVKKLKRQRCGSAKCPRVAHEADSSPLEGGMIIGPTGNVGSLVENTQMGIHSSDHEAQEPSSSALDSIDQVEVQVLPNVANVGDTTIQSCVPNLAVAENSKTCERNCFEAGKSCQSENTRVLLDVIVLENDSPQHDLTVEDAKDDGKTLCVDYLASSRSESAVSSKTESLDRNSFKLERCTALKGDDSYSSADGLHLLKSCTCSFCTKAAYIWSDLHYQDVKGRISTLTKSQKEASNLSQRFSCENPMSRQGLENSTEAMNLEIDLMSQWKSLFLHMENVFVDESNQLQSNFLALKEIRDDFKTSLESINGGMPSYMQTCSSDASDHRTI